MKTNFWKLLVCALLMYAPLQTMAWGDKGHRIAGQIASTYLTPKAKAAIKAILGNESVAMSSTWADFIKSDPAYNYLSTWHYVDFDKPFNYPTTKLFKTGYQRRCLYQVANDDWRIEKEEPVG
jgi:hypothetical protein